VVFWLTKSASAESTQQQPNMVQSRCDSAAALDMMPHQKGGPSAYEIQEHTLQALTQPHHQQQAPQQHDSHHAYQRMCLNPAEIYNHVADGGQAKHRNSWLKELVLGIIAGVFIGFGFATCMIAAGQVRPRTPWGRYLCHHSRP
jgi:hypothetical protein